MNEEINKKDYKDLTYFKRWTLENFPFIEADFDAITNYQLYCKIVEYLNNVIYNQNQVQDLSDELVDGYNNLVEYVNNYFNNLDVQEEINNKLDEMAEDGTLTNLIKAYVDPIYQEYENGINARIDVIDTKVDLAVGTSPIPVASTSSMTDETKVYVNTTDGKWYYYDGTNWTAGGTYQSTGLADDSVTYCNLADLVKKGMYKVVTPSDLIWVEGVSRYNGGVNSDATVFSSQLFLVTKGTVITASDSDIKSRYTFYDLDGGYIGNTGTFTYRSTYTVQQDCWVCISSNWGEYTKTQVAALYSCDCLIPNLTNINFDFYYTYNNKVESDSIFVTKGTKISLTDYGVYNSSNNLSDSCAYIGYNKYGLDKISHTYKNMGLDTNYSNTEITIDEDCYIKIYIRLKGNKTILETDLPLLQNALKISYINSYANNFINNHKYRVYISDNAPIELFTNSQYAYWRIINPNKKLIVKEDGETIYEETFTNILIALSSYAVEYNGNNYIRLPYSRALYLSLFDNNLYVSNLDTDPVGEKNIFLLVNAYGNILDCELLTLLMKSWSSATNIFNSSDYNTNIDWKTKVGAFSYELTSCSDNIETFTFFTDPHLMGAGSTDFTPELEKYIGTLQKVYNSSPMNFIVGGGDWLRNNDTPEQASLKLGYVDGFMHSMFKNYYGILGNHDTNYQGTESLNTDALVNLMYRDTKQAYFSFNGINTKGYCLDTGVDNNLSMDTYRWTQVKWLGDSLTADDPEHAVVFMHIITHQENLSSMADNITKLIKAYNDHDTITLNSVSYDFTGCSGHVDYVLGGHTHEDDSDTYNGVLCIITTTFAYNQNTPTFDMIINDYDNNKAYFYRFGNGSDREFNI